MSTLRKFKDFVRWGWWVLGTLATLTPLGFDILLHSFEKIEYLKTAFECSSR